MLQIFADDIFLTMFLVIALAAGSGAVPIGGIRFSARKWKAPKDSVAGGDSILEIARIELSRAVTTNELVEAGGHRPRAPAPPPHSAKTISCSAASSSGEAMS